MYDSGYKSYRDPRLQPPQRPQGPTCSDCDYYFEVESIQQSNKFVHLVGACAFEVYHAKTIQELGDVELVGVDPTDEACRDFRGDA